MPRPYHRPIHKRLYHGDGTGIGSICDPPPSEYPMEETTIEAAAVTCERCKALMEMRRMKRCQD